MLHERRGQVSAEAFAAAIMLLLTMIFVLVQNADRSREAGFVESAGVQRAECEALASAIMLVQAGQENAQIELNLENDANISRNTIDFKDAYCSFSGQKITAQLSNGKVTVRKIGGAMSVQGA